MTKVRFMFEDIVGSAEALETVLLDARETDKFYRFAGVSAEQILKSGLIIEGEDIEHLVEKLTKVEGSVKFVE